MNYIEPILYVSGDNEMFILDHSDQKIKKDFDIMIPYEYQRKHFELILDYIAPEYYKMCISRYTLYDTINDIGKSPYSDYFKYFLVKFLMDNGKYDAKDFIRWLNKSHPIYIKKRNIKILRYFDLKRYYNTIVIDLDISKGNKWNMLWGLPPNLFNKNTMLKVLDYLTEGGKLVFLHPEYSHGKIFDYTRTGFKEIEEHYFIKEETPKNEFKLPRRWL